MIMGNTNLYLSKGLRIFKYLKDDMAVRDLSKVADSFNSVTYEWIKRYEKLNWITTEKIGRRRVMTLTNRGKSIQKSILNIEGDLCEEM